MRHRPGGGQTVVNGGGTDLREGGLVVRQRLELGPDRFGRGSEGTEDLEELVNLGVALEERKAHPPKPKKEAGKAGRVSPKPQYDSRHERGHGTGWHGMT